MHKAFLETQQRPFRLPHSPWLLTQKWRHLLFCHWPISAEKLQLLVPPQLSVQEYQGTAWLGIIPFIATDTRVRGCPRFPYFHQYLELNVRTYVAYKGTPGIYFITIDANKWAPVMGARLAAFLPYFYSQIRFRQEHEMIHFCSRRRGSEKGANQFSIDYRPSHSCFLPNMNSLEYWLYERYCSFTVKKGKVYQANIHHDRWRIHDVKGKVEVNTLLPNLSGFSGSPIMHYSPEKQVYVWSNREVK